MQSESLKSELRAILDIEERVPIDWILVQRRCLDLIGRLIAEGAEKRPEIVSHFLDDPDIRKKDGRYGDQQREQLKRWLESEGS